MSQPFRWIAALFLAGQFGAAIAETMEGRILGITDGDTVTRPDVDNPP